MSYTRHYQPMDKAEADKASIADIREYCSKDQWDVLMQAVGQVTAGTLSVKQLNWCFGIAGISGYPFHAFCRKYCLKEYREWMHSGTDAIMTDEKGYSL